jgi:hypothetical protein
MKGPRADPRELRKIIIGQDEIHNAGADRRCSSAATA